MEGNKAKVHAIQYRIISSLDAKLLAIREVTTKNKIQSIITIDSTEAISHKKKIKLAYQLKLNRKGSPIKIKSISKYGKSKSQSLSMLIIQDRAKQILIKLALEPEWEAVFEPSSYGFRPGKSFHDSIATLSFSFKRKSRYVLNVNLQKCFDKINHKKLLKKLSTFSLIEYQLKAWLETEIMIDYLNRPDEIFQAMEGKLQNLIISPLLANIALHGLENHIRDWYTNIWPVTSEKNSKITMGDRKISIGFSRYADDFIITVPLLIDINEIQTQITLWLFSEVGLTISNAKMKVVNSTKGFEFLGFQIITIKNPSTKEYKVKIHPSQVSKNRIIQRIRYLIRENKSVSSYSLINLLSNRIIGWANYFCFSECIQDFSKIDYLIFNQIRAWVFRRKSKGLKSRIKLKLKYFPERNTYSFRGKNYKNNWVLTGKILIKSGVMKENFLPKMVWIGLSQYVKIKEQTSPYDGNHLYWVQRVKSSSGFNNRIYRLIQTQNGHCK